MLSRVACDSFTFDKTALQAKCNVLQMRMLPVDFGDKINFRDNLY